MNRKILELNTQAIKLIITPFKKHCLPDLHLGLCGFNNIFFLIQIKPKRIKSISFKNKTQTTINYPLGNRGHIKKSII